MSRYRPIAKEPTTSQESLLLGAIIGVAVWMLLKKNGDANQKKLDAIELPPGSEILILGRKSTQLLDKYDRLVLALKAAGGKFSEQGYVRVSQIGKRLPDGVSDHLDDVVHQLKRILHYVEKPFSDLGRNSSEAAIDKAHSAAILAASFAHDINGLYYRVKGSEITTEYTREGRPDMVKLPNNITAGNILKATDILIKTYLTFLHIPQTDWVVKQQGWFKDTIGMIEDTIGDALNYVEASLP